MRMEVEVVHQVTDELRHRRDHVGTGIGELVALTR
jgi:hypothetical protein